jgi:hypothetical protein
LSFLTVLFLRSNRNKQRSAGSHIRGVKHRAVLGLFRGHTAEIRISLVSKTQRNRSSAQIADRLRVALRNPVL